MNEFFPLNELEFDLLAAKRNEISVSEFVRKLVSSDLALPTGSRGQFELVRFSWTS